jgi:serine/threonine-protein kinase
MSGRRNNLPLHWSEEKKEREMQVPQWLIATIQKCLEKYYQDRFKNGVELHRYIVHNSTMLLGSREANALNATILQSENERLRTLLIQYQEAAKNHDSTGFNPHKVLSLNEVLSAKLLEENNELADVPMPRSRKKSIAGILIFLILVAAGAGLTYKFRAKLGIGSTEARDTTTRTESRQAPSLAQYRVISPKAYFHNLPDENTRRVAYLLSSNDTIDALKETGDFIYTEFYNNKRQLSKGWLKKEDLAPLGKQNSDDEKPALSSNTANNIVQLELVRAAKLLAGNQAAEALTIYSKLAKQGVPQAMYQYGDLALRGKNYEINCLEGVDWINKAANKGYTIAKRTLGLLYLYAGDEMVMMANDYIPCPA